MVTEQFQEWACSLSGCDNNNLDADIWLSGIEYGIEEKDREKYYSGGLQEEIQKGPHHPEETNFDWTISLRYPYYQSMAKLLCAYKGQSVGVYKHVENHCAGTEVFKANLYPIAFRNTNDELWKKNGLNTTTGFEIKHLYQIWCFFNRFPDFAQRVEDHKPKLIIGTGISFLIDFFACFGGYIANKHSHIKTDVLENNKASGTNNSIRRYYWGKLNEKTTLVVIPFFSGRYGLNSDALRQEMGDRIRSLVNRDTP